MRKVAIVGYGDLAYQIINLIEQNDNSNNEYVFFDDFAFERKLKKSFSFNEYLDDKFRDYEFCVCLGYKHLKLKNKIINRLIDNKRKLLTFIHPTSHVDKTSVIEEGVIIYPMCNIDYKSIIKRGTLLNNSVVISHESIVGECNFLAPGVVLNGGVSTGSQTFIGARVTVSNSINIGQNCVIGVGSVITKDIKDDTFGIGNPFTIKNKITIK